jgi:hypothetical protein
VTTFRTFLAIDIVAFLAILIACIALDTFVVIVPVLVGYLNGLLTGSASR